jgi:hypothetical protein
MVCSQGKGKTNMETHDTMKVDRVCGDESLI